MGPQQFMLASSHLSITVISYKGRRSALARTNAQQWISGAAKNCSM